MSSKKGVGYTDFGERAGEVGAAWCFNWIPEPSAKSSLEFVPMVWGQHGSLAQSLLIPKPGAHASLLGFNEPDDTRKANLSVEEVLEVWPRLMETGSRLGSPAVSGWESEGGWLDHFMKGVTAKGFRVDFMAVHWYGPMMDDRAVEYLQDKLAEVHDRYGRPVWLTEFGAFHMKEDPPYTQEVVSRFIRGAVPMMESLPYVERYAWFATATTEWEAYRLSSLFDAAGAITPTGIAYRDAG